MKKIAWIDTLRVTSAFLVIVAHFLMCDAFKGTYIGYALCYDVASIVNTTFLALSGYLIPASLERMPNLGRFYWRKIIRVVVPFTVSYFVMTALAILPALLNETFSTRVPLISVLHGGKLSHMIYGMFPTDINIVKYFGSNVYWFVGEWFMWAILGLYLISPLLYKVAKKFPLAALPGSIAVVCAVYYATLSLTEEGRIHSNETIFLVRISEFMMGMLLYMYRDKLMKVRFQLVMLILACFAIYTIYFLASWHPLDALYFPMSILPRYVMLLAIVYLVFIFTEIICSSRLKIIEWYNSFSGVSYLAMIVQHIIIYCFADIVGFEGRSLPELAVILLLITVITFKLAARIKKLTDPIERALTNVT